ncbi:CinA family protein [Phaeovulum vinaykumarii]|uniref:Nicotinamide-nucleotide amidase n=1 Tax=Phaeovulum vinaykumarii TaxID=407234 RepID=A0A1N7LMC9_9RHOB|nr:nicotinamide-nucleotide amidohydrolase family protein [Phaeovulum vinaykumarii]SIS74939.1 nicotinamide-nucleotide amidase [Phaeovulum vinaykumarii]SOC05372.1 nicotinamide-nucleotide amidase [Phaeovulum vinaykumarii]
MSAEGLSGLGADLAERAEAVIAAARAQGVWIVTAESCTGGLLAASLTEIAGASRVVEGGVVSYSNGVKRAVLGVSARSLQGFGAVSEPVAREMAKGALAMAEHAATAENAGPRARLAIAITGIAGPGGSEFKPEGRVCFALAQMQPGHAPEIRAETVEFGARGRGAVRLASARHALTRLEGALALWPALPVMDGTTVA